MNVGQAQADAATHGSSDLLNNRNDDEDTLQVVFLLKTHLSYVISYIWSNQIRPQV